MQTVRDIEEEKAILSSVSHGLLTSILTEHCRGILQSGYEIVLQLQTEKGTTLRYNLNAWKEPNYGTQHLPHSLA